MIGDACVFALTQISNDFACQHGELVTRRAGPDIACDSAAMQEQCACVYKQLKSMGLSAFNFEDDLTQVPHGVWKKIQFGGLQGLNRLCCDAKEDRIDNIADIIKAVMSQYAELDELPEQQIVMSMQAYRTQRRKK